MRKLVLKPITLSMNSRMRRRVLDCGDGVCEVTALAALATPKLADAKAIPGQSGNSADSVAAVQKLAHQPMPRQFMAPMRVQSWRSKLPKRWLPRAVATPVFRFRGTRFAAVACLLLFLPLAAPLHAQLAAPNYVLSLGGTNGFLELPSGAFNDLEEVTIEGWVKSLMLGTWWNPGQPFGLLNSRRARNLPV